MREGDAAAEEYQQLRGVAMSVAFNQRPVRAEFAAGIIRNLFDKLDCELHLETDYFASRSFDLQHLVARGRAPWNYIHQHPVPPFLNYLVLMHPRESGSPDGRRDRVRVK